MKNNFLLVILVLFLSIAVYFVGKKNGSNNVVSTVVQNINLVEQIAELSALSVNGTTTAKVTNNTGNGAMWDKFQNYFTENTLQVTIPYEAKFGVSLRNKKIIVDTKQQTAVLYLPAVTLLSLQLHVDKIETMNQTGLLASTSIADLVKVEKQIYSQVLESMGQNTSYKKQAELQITNTLKNYYEPLGYKVECRFGKDVSSVKQ